MVAMSSVVESSKQPSARVLALAVLLVSAAAIVGGSMPHGGWLWLHWLAKPLATVLILVTALWGGRAISPRYRRRIAAGMVFSLIGDVLLMLPQNLFVAGLVAFLVGHLCFIAAFVDDSRFAVRPLALLACVLVGAVNLALLWSSIPVALHPAVALYGLVLSCMGGQALARAWFHAKAGDPLALPARRAAIGGLLFMLSDSLLAWNRFDAPLPLSALWILGSYYAALWFIARSVAHDTHSTKAGPLS